MTPKEWLEWIDGAEANKILGLSPMRELLADWTADREKWRQDTHALAGRIQRVEVDRAAAMALVRELREAAKPFVEAARVYDLYDGPPTHRHLRDNHEILCAGHGDELATLTVGDLRKLRARAEALAGEPGEGGEEKREDFAARMIRTYSPREEKPQGGKRG